MERFGGGLLNFENSRNRTERSQNSSNFSLGFQVRVADLERRQKQMRYVEVSVSNNGLTQQEVPNSLEA